MKEAVCYRKKKTHDIVIKMLGCHLGYYRTYLIYRIHACLCLKVASQIILKRIILDGNEFSQVL